MNNDLFSRQVVVECVYMALRTPPLKGAFTDTMSLAVRMVNDLPPAQPEIIYCKDCKHHWTHKCMDSMPIEICDLNQTFYDANIDYCSLAERREE